MQVHVEHIKFFLCSLISDSFEKHDEESNEFIANLAEFVDFFNLNLPVEKLQKRYEDNIPIEHYEYKTKRLHNDDDIVYTKGMSNRELITLVERECIDIFGHFPLTYDEIAIVLGVKHRAQIQHVEERALKKLRAMLDEINVNLRDTNLSH